MSVNASNYKSNFIAPEFDLISVDEKYYKLKNLTGKKGTVIAFICNHCPYVTSIIDRFVYETNELEKIGIKTIAIMSNDTKLYPDDSFENMKIFSKKNNFNFPYLFDEKQEVAKSYDAQCTPDIFGFDKDNLLKYRGRLDSGVINNSNKNIKRELFYAMELISKTNNGPIEQFNSFGCSIKWTKNE